MTQRIGIIDIGTNTFNLLIVDRSTHSFEKIYSAKQGVGLGLGGINDGRLAEDAIARGIQTLKEYILKSTELGVEKLKAFATSAVRDAKNKSEFVARLRDELSLDVEVISGDREAELIYEGVKIGHDFENTSVIMDIGGGSTEFIFADKMAILKAHSFNIGTARIYQMFEFSDPYSSEDIQRVNEYLAKNIGGFFDDMKADVLIGASGSFETFYALLYKREYPENEFEDMPADEVIRVLDEIIASSLDERNANPFIIPIRKKMAPIAAIKIKWVLEKLKIKTLTISPYAMKEGVIKLI